MKKTKKQKMRRFFIMVTAIFIILLAVMFFVEGRSKDGNNDIEQIDSENNENEEKPSNEEEQNNAETPAENDPSNEDNEEDNVEVVEDEVEPEENDGVKNIVANPEAYDALVNKKNNLDDTYVPDDLVSLDDVPTVLKNPEVNQLREDAYIALKELFAAAKDEAEYELYARSGYRSYYTQDALYKSYVSNNGQAAADKYSAKPGQSEHQTGLAMDITCEALNYLLDDTFGDTEEGKWVSENAHRFGFIVRYPKRKEDITGYLFEPWHIRYLGIELATKVYESGLTLEEYLEQ
ncbi:MAG: M15 family metallopeptidase [Sedimentibacter sp.]